MLSSGDRGTGRLFSLTLRGKNKGKYILHTFQIPNHSWPWNPNWYKALGSDGVYNTGLDMMYLWELLIVLISLLLSCITFNTKHFLFTVQLDYHHFHMQHGRPGLSCLLSHLNPTEVSSLATPSLSSPCDSYSLTPCSKYPTHLKDLSDR